jgi:geranylgeranyl diphosphate synthase, type I
MPDPTTLSPADAARVRDLMDRYRDGVLAGMRRALDLPGVQHVRYMRYHLGWEDAAGGEIDAGAGKMLRPALCLLCCEAVGGEPRRAMPAAVALELLHNFTLIHDDIEDGSETRHGRPTLWTLVGVPQAINAGDGLFVLARRTLLELAGESVREDRVLRAARVLDDACVTLCEGQHADLGFESRPRVSQAEYEAMIAGKTAALLGAAAEIGAIAGGADDETARALGQYGRMLGMAFQVQDDALGIWGDPDVTRKPVSDDIRSRKKSFPVVYAMDHLGGDDRERIERIYGADTVGENDVAQVLALLDTAGARGASSRAAQRWASAATEALRPLSLGDARAELEALAAFVVHRSA